MSQRKLHAASVPAPLLTLHVIHEVLAAGADGVALHDIEAAVAPNHAGAVLNALCEAKLGRFVAVPTRTHPLGAWVPTDNLRAAVRALAERAFPTPRQGARRRA